ncbi:hypothetical protein RUR49_07245 [Pseudoxanthobacter sp. M-2]|uniref:hypothetical protein n=1 Tax=Pseudoxanthobacter sp. M-2 TaxID=3078754 RepID=UPI0038FCF8AD
MFHIHIGAHKVGSTSLQRFFTLNAGLLEELGVSYPQVGFGTFAHHPLAKAFTESKHVHERAELKAALARLAAEAPDKTFLLSSEVFEFARPDGVGELAEAVAPHQAQILFYVRDFTRMIPSKYAQRTKTGGNHKNFDDFLDIAHEMRWLAFTRLVSTWAHHFGWDAIRVQVLDRETLVGGDLLKDAWAALGLPVEAFSQCDPASLEPVNTSPNWVALEAVREVNRRLSTADLGLPKDEKTKGLRHIKALEEARFAVEGLRVGKLLAVCEQASVEAGLADKPGQYLTSEQWSTLHGLFRSEIERLNRRLPGAPIRVPSTRPPAERTFLPQLSELTAQERLRLGRRVLAARQVKKLPPQVIETIGSAFGVRARPPRVQKLDAWHAVTMHRLRRALGLSTGRTQELERRKELAAARRARVANNQAPEADAAGAPAVTATAGAGDRAGRRPTLMRRIERRFARWSRRLRGERPSSS